MRIHLKQTLTPFSHLPGSRCMIPYTTWEAQIFPTKALLRDLTSDEKAEISLPFGGALEGFTVMLNLERGRIEIFSKGKKRFFLTADSHQHIQAYPLESSKKRLSLGVSKKQDWDLVQRRNDLAEIFPFWLRLSQLIPNIALPKKAIGTMHLLNEERFHDFFLAGFEGIFCPRLEDRNYLGLFKEEVIPEGSCPIGLIHQGARLIEALFFKEEGEGLFFLPNLPPAFHAGRFIHLHTTFKDRIDIEWSKKALKKIIIYPGSNRTVQLILQKKFKHFRIRDNLRKKGVIFSAKQPIELKPNQVLYIDRLTS